MTQVGGSGVDLAPLRHDGSDVGGLACHGFTGSPQGVRPPVRAFVDAGYGVRDDAAKRVDRA